MKIAFASDHAGFALKTLLADHLRQTGRTVLDLGAHDQASVDYPDYADRMAAAFTRGEAARGVLICGSGIGIEIAANRHAHIRAANCLHVTMARMARSHNDANVLVLGARLIGVEVARDCLQTFLDTPFEGGRHAARVAKLGTRA